MNGETDCIDLHMPGNASLVFISVTFATMLCCPLKGLINLCFSLNLLSN